METRPAWQGAAIDGIAPLMAPAQLQAALDAHGYRQVACSSTRPASANPLAAGEDLVCFEAPGRPMRLSFAMFDLHEGRSSAVVYFNERYDSAATDYQRLAHARAFAHQLRARFGAPFSVTRTPQFTTFYWRRPGGSSSLPDLLSTTVGETFGANATMTSFWAYGQKRTGR